MTEVTQSPSGSLASPWHPPSRISENNCNNIIHGEKTEEEERRKKEGRARKEIKTRKGRRKREREREREREEEVYMQLLT